MLNNILISKINLRYSGDENSIQTYGKGSYYTGSKEYAKEYSFQDNFAILLTCNLENSENSQIISDEDLPDMENAAYGDDNVFIKSKNDFVSISALAEELTDLDYINIDNNNDIYIIPEMSKINIDLINCEILVYNQKLNEELELKNINIKNIKKEEYDIVDLILEKYIK